jgi:hypothetical protein
VLLIPPASLKIMRVTREVKPARADRSEDANKFTIRIVLESVDNELQYLHKSIIS